MQHPPNKLIEAVQASMNEEFANLMDALMMMVDFRAYFDRKHYKRYEVLDRRYKQFMAKRERDQLALAKRRAKATTLEQKAEHASRMLAVIEKHTETMGKLSSAFRELIQSQTRAS
jgi:hypothetical protein